jgi:Ala-tRNA(Pro) deacylase
VSSLIFFVPRLDFVSCNSVSNERPGVQEHPHSCAAAPDKVVFDKLRSHLSTEDVMPAPEEEIRSLFPDCDEGAEPPFGNLYGIRTIMDSVLEEEDHIVFQAGTHDQAIRMSMADYLALVQPEIVDFAYRPERRS